MTLQEIHDYVCPLLDVDDLARQKARLMICCADGDLEVSRRDLEHVNATAKGLACPHCSELAESEDADDLSEDSEETTDLSWLEEGRQYGYPDCCILFFHRVWGPLALATASIHAKILQGKRCTDDERILHNCYVEHKQHLDGSGYVPCPACLAHQWQFDLGTPPRKAYHDRVWARKMDEVGLGSQGEVHVVVATELPERPCVIEFHSRR